MEKNDCLQRVMLIMKHYGMKQRPFAIKVGISPQTLNTTIVNDTKPSLSLIQDILRAFPEVSAEWLVLGDGDMIKPPKEDENWKVTQFIPVQNNELVDALKDHIASLKAENEHLRKDIEEYKREKSGQAVAASGYGFVAAEDNPLTKTEMKSDIKQ